MSTNGMHLFNADPLGLLDGLLWHKDREDTVLERGLDSILVHTSWECECALESSDRALRGPVLVCCLLSFWLWLVLGD